MISQHKMEKEKGGGDLGGADGTKTAVGTKPALMIM